MIRPVTGKVRSARVIRVWKMAAIDNPTPITPNQMAAGRSGQTLAL